MANWLGGLYRFAMSGLSEEEAETKCKAFRSLEQSCYITPHGSPDPDPMGLLGSAVVTDELGGLPVNGAI